MDPGVRDAFVRPFIHYDAAALTQAVLLGALMAALPVLFSEEPYDAQNMVLPCVTVVYVYLHSHSKGWFSTEAPKAEGPSLPSQSSANVPPDDGPPLGALGDLVAGLAVATTGEPFEVATGTEAVVVWELDTSDEQGLKQFDSIAGRYDAQAGLAFVAAARQPREEVRAFVRNASRRPTAAALVSDAASLLDAGGGIVFLLSVDSQGQASLRWRGRLVSLEAALGRAFPWAESDSSEDEAS